MVQDPDAVRTQLDKILSSEGFVNAGRICRFLRFAVEAKLRGEEGQLKEYVLGREVFDRDESYDPRLDPIVRVEARRLRAKLDEYYEGAGRSDPMRIEFPKGGYAPVIQPATEILEPPRKRRNWWIPLAAALLVMLTAGGIYRLTRPARGEMIAVVPSSWLTSSPGEPDKLEEGLAETIGAELANRQVTRVMAWPYITPHRSAHRDPRGAAKALGVSRLLLVSVRQGSQPPRVTLYFVDAISGQKIWVKDYSREGLSEPTVRQELAQRVAAEFPVQPQGGR